MLIVTPTKGEPGSPCGQPGREYVPTMQRGVRDMRSSIVALADENVRCRPATSTHTGVGEPVEVYGAGVSGAAGLLPREHVGLCLGRGPSGPTPSGEGRLTGKGTLWRSCSTGSPAWMLARRRGGCAAAPRAHAVGGAARRGRSRRCRVRCG